MSFHLPCTSILFLSIYNVPSSPFVCFLLLLFFFCPVCPIFFTSYSRDLSPFLPLPPDLLSIAHYHLFSFWLTLYLYLFLSPFPFLCLPHLLVFAFCFSHFLSILLFFFANIALCICAPDRLFKILSFFPHPCLPPMSLYLFISTYFFFYFCFLITTPAVEVVFLCWSWSSVGSPPSSSSRWTR